MILISQAILTYYRVSLQNVITDNYKNQLTVFLYKYIISIDMNRKIRRNDLCAVEDAKVEAEVLIDQLEMYQDLPRDVAGLSSICYQTKSDNIDAEGKFIWIEGKAVCNFGKNKGRPLREIAAEYPDYLEWNSRGDFSAEVKDIVIKALGGESSEPSELPQPVKDEI